MEYGSLVRMKKKKKGNMALWCLLPLFTKWPLLKWPLVQINFPKKGIKEKKLFSQIVKIQNGIEL